MRVHANQVNPYAQQDALYAAQRAAAKREAAKTRRKLMESASAMAGESDSEETGVAKLQARQESQEQTKRQNPQKQGSRKKLNEAAESGEADRSISEWA
jgi:hypothetical protein